MLINSVSGGSKDVEAVTYVSASAPSKHQMVTSDAIAPSTGSTGSVEQVFQRDPRSEAEPEYVYGFGYVGCSSWGYVILRGSDLLGDGVEATFITPQGSSFGAGKKIRVRFQVEATVKATTYWTYTLVAKVVESEISSSNLVTLTPGMYYVRDSKLVLE